MPRAFFGTMPIGFLVFVGICAALVLAIVITKRIRHYRKTGQFSVPQSEVSTHLPTNGRSKGWNKVFHVVMARTGYNIPDKPHAVPDLLKIDE